MVIRGSSPGGVRKRSGRLETAATIKARGMRKRREKQLSKQLGRNVEIQTIGSKEVVIDVKQPELFTRTGERAKPDSKGVVRGFSRADLTKIKSLDEAKKKEEAKKLREITRKVVARGTTTGITTDLVPANKLNREVVKEQVQSIVSTLPSGRVIAGVQTRLRKGPTRVKAFEGKVEPLQQVVKPSKIDVVVQKFRKVERKTAEKLKLDDLSDVLLKPRKILGNRSVVGSQVLLPSKIVFGLPFIPRTFRKKGEDFFVEVSEGVVSDTLRNPITNSALILSGAGFTRATQLGSLKLAQLGSSSPKVAKALGVSGSVAGGLLGAAYTGSVIDRGVKEFSKTGKLTDTTSDLLRELLMFKLGSNVGGSVKLQKLSKLRKDLNDLPKDARVKLDKQFDRLLKKPAKDFDAKEVGLVTKLDSQTISQSVRNAFKGRRVGVESVDNIVTGTENKIFFAKRVPKRTAKFDVVVLKKDTFGQPVRAVVEAKFVNGRVVTGKVKSAKIVSDKDFASEVKTIKKGVKVVKDVRKVPVKAFEKSGKPKDILQLSNRKVLDDIDDITILSNKNYNKLYSSTSTGVYVRRGTGRKEIIIRDTADFRKNLLTKDDFNKLLTGKIEGFKGFRSRAQSIKNTILHEKAHSVDLTSVQRPIFDGVKNINTNEQFLKFVKKLHKQGVLPKNKDVKYFMGAYKPNDVPLEVRAELYKTFITNPNKLKKVQPKIYNNIVNNFREEGFIPTLKKIGTKDVKINIKASERKIESVIGIDRKRVVKFEPSFEEVVSQQRFVQFQIAPKSNKVVPKVKDSPKISTKKKFDEFVFVDVNTGVGLQVKKIGKLSVVSPKPVSKKPVVKAEPVKVDSDLKVFPIPKSEPVSKPKSKKPVVKAEPRNIGKPISRVIPIQEVIPKQVSKPKIRVGVSKKGKSKPRVVSKPRITVKVAQKQLQELKPVVKPKVGVKEIVKKVKSKKFLVKGKPVKIFPIIPILSKKKLVLSDLKKFSVGQVTEFTTTIKRPKKGKAKGVLFGKVELFTGAELR